MAAVQVELIIAAFCAGLNISAYLSSICSVPANLKCCLHSFSQEGWITEEAESVPNGEVEGEEHNAAEVKQCFVFFHIMTDILVFFWNIMQFCLIALLYLLYVCVRPS